MKRIAAVLLVAGSLSVAGQASAHGYYYGGGSNSGAIFGALVGGAVLGAVVASAVAPAPVYAQPAPPPGYCFDSYRGAYVACGPQPQAPQYPRQGW